MKRKLISVALAVVMVSSLTACGASGSASATAAPPEQQSGEEETGASSEEKKVLTVTFKDDNQGGGHPRYVWFKKSYEEWDQKDGIDLELAPITSSEEDYYTKVALRLADKNTCPDTVIEGTFQLPSDVSAGYLTNLDSYVAGYPERSDGTYYDSLKAGSVAEDDSVYGIPYSASARGIWYNKEIFRQAGLPQEWQSENWQDILGACAVIRANVPDVIPLWRNSGVVTGEVISMQTYEMSLYGTGEQLLDENGKWIVKSRVVEDILQFISDIYTNSYGPSLSLILNGQATNTARCEYLPQQRLAMSTDGAWICASWEEIGASPWPEYQEIMGFAAMPTQNGGGVTTMSGGWSISIPENPDMEDEASAFIKKLMEPPLYTESVIAQGSIVTKTDAAADEAYTSLPFRTEATDLLEGAFFRPQNGQCSAATNNIQTMVEAVVSGSMPEDAMNQYAMDVTRVVGGDNVAER